MIIAVGLPSFKFCCLFQSAVNLFLTFLYLPSSSLGIMSSKPIFVVLEILIFQTLQDVNNPFIKEILSTGSSSVTASVLANCIITPFLEEVVYRGFLVTSLASTMNWKLAVTISSIVFSASHFSGENFLQLFVVGFVLGCSYCWTGNLIASISIHSLYNALILYLTFIS